MKKKHRIPALIKIALFCFATYAAISMIHLQLQINQKSSALRELDAQIQSKTVENEALRESVTKGASDDYIGSIARDKLGYASPGERVFVDASSK